MDVEVDGMGIVGKDPVVCMPTWREFESAAYQSAAFEAQDVLADVCNLDLVRLKPGRAFRAREYVHQRLARRDPTGIAVSLNPGLSSVALQTEYDLFIVYCQTSRELLYLNGIRGWKARARQSVCILAEEYANEVAADRHLLRLMGKFDHVFTELSGSTAAISDVIGRRCDCLQPAIDTLRFAPSPAWPDRVIDVYSIGRRRETMHKELLKAAGNDELFYVYDTFSGGAGARVTDYWAHRQLLAAKARRSLCFIVAPSKWDSPLQTAGQVAISSRYIEGAAAGAVLVGQPSDSAEFRDMFDWDNVVIACAEDGSDVVSTIKALKADRDFSAAIGRQNAAHALLRHDWVYRWRQVFQRAGIEPGPRLSERVRHLKALASATQAT
jgi:hypothetical protein